MQKLPIKEYIASFTTAGLFFFALGGYLFLRRGFFDIFIANKAIAGVAFMLLAFVLSLGILTRIYQIFDHFLPYRKELGITSFFFVFLHSIISFFMLPDRFPLSYFQSHLFTFFFGLTATSVVFVLFVISLHFIKDKINPKHWWHMQSWGVRVAGVSALLHVIPMKYNGWVSWYTAGGNADLARPYLPPGSILVASFGLYVLLIRVFERISKEKSPRFITIAGYLYVIFLGVTFGLGIGR